MKRPLLLSLLVATVPLFGHANPTRADVFNIADGDVAGLKAAINTANSNGVTNEINLASGGTYTLTTVDNTDGFTGDNNGLPVITPSLGLIINGNGATVARSTANGIPLFRIFRTAGYYVELNSLTIANGGTNNPGGYGGGISNANIGVLVLQNCTIANNTAGDGGGIENQGACRINTFDAETTITLKNCTLSGNTGGAVFNHNGGIARFYNCTISNNSYGILTNTAPPPPPFQCQPTETRVGGTILKNSGANMTGNFSIIDEGFNLSSDNAGGFFTAATDRINTDPKLDPAGPQKNGGSTPTIALLEGSPAIDNGNAANFGLTKDQRGKDRPFDFASVPNGSGSDGSDIGAYEAVADFVQPEPVSLKVNVNTDHDDGTCGVTDCTLREAIDRANGVSGDNTITFAPAVTGTILLGSALPAITTNINVQGPGARALGVSGNNTVRVFSFIAGSSAVSGLTIRDGADLPILGTALGGGIYNQATLTINACTFTANRAQGPNAFIGSGDSANGGGLYNGGTLNVNRCTFSNNGTSGGRGANSGLRRGAGAGGSGNGSALYNDSSGSLTLANCTFAGNSASGGAGGDGGSSAGANGGNGNGVFFNYGTSTLTACTFSGNSGAGAAGGTGTPGGAAGTGYGGLVQSSSGGSSTVRNTISAANTTSDANGGFSSNGYNLIGNGTGSSGWLAGDRVGTSGSPINAMLATLQNNGGPTDTMALLSGSPAINNGGSAEAPWQDQRYYLRNGTADIGAFEFSGTVGPISAVSRKTHGTGGPTFDINLPLTGTVGVECRQVQGINSNDHQVIMTFPVAVSLTNVSATPDPSATPAATGSVSSFNVNGSQVTVNLTGVSNAQRLTITLSNVNDGVNTNNAFNFRAGFLLGDVNGSEVVTSGDTNLCKAQALQQLTNANFRTDINASGIITSGDANIIKQNALRALP